MAEDFIKQNQPNTQTPEEIPEKSKESLPSDAYLSLEDELKSLLKSISQARAKKDKAKENLLCKKAQEAFRFTGENLLEKAKLLAVDEAKSENFKVIDKNSIFSENNFNNELEKFRLEQQIFGLRRGWELISQQGQKEYGGDMNLFASKTEKKREALVKSGLNISKEIFYNMIGSGYMFSDLKKKFFSNKIQTPIFLGDGVYRFSTMPKKEFEGLLGILQALFDSVAKKAVEDKLNKKVLQGKKRWHERKMRKIRELLQGAVDNIEKEKQFEELRQKMQQQIRMRSQVSKIEPLQKITQDVEQEALKRLKKFEHEEKKVDKEIKKELQKITKRVDKDIKETEKEEQKISRLLEKEKKKDKISSKKTAYLNSINKIEAKDEKEEETLPADHAQK